MDNPEAMKRYYELLLSILRIITSMVLSRGPQNVQTIEQARLFLIQDRATMIGIFKRQANIGGIINDKSCEDLEDLVEIYVLLISLTGFLDVSLLTLGLPFQADIK